MGSEVNWDPDVRYITHFVLAVIFEQKKYLVWSTNKLQSRIIKNMGFKINLKFFTFLIVKQIKFCQWYMVSIEIQSHNAQHTLTIDVQLR